jgi:hypothetical protein
MLKKMLHVDYCNDELKKSQATDVKEAAPQDALS